MTSTDRTEYDLITVLGPSSSGKTYAVQNYLMNNINKEGEYIDQIYSIDGGDMREASMVYNAAVKLYQTKTYRTLFSNTKSKLIPTLIKNIKNDIKKVKNTNTVPSDPICSIFWNELDNNKGNLECHSKNMVIHKNPKQWKCVKKLDIEPTISSTCIFMSNEDEKKCYEELDAKNVKRLYDEEIKAMKKDYNQQLLLASIKKNTQENLNNANLDTVPKITFVDTFNNPLYTDESKINKLIDKINDNEFKNRQKIYFLVLSPIGICTIKGKYREICEGKKYSNSAWKTSVNNGFNILKNQIDTKNELYIYLNMASKPTITNKSVTPAAKYIGVYDNATKISYEYDYITGDIPKYELDKKHHCEDTDSNIINKFSLKIEGELLKKFIELENLINTFNKKKKNNEITLTLTNIKDKFHEFSDKIGNKIKTHQHMGGGKTKTNKKTKTKNKTKKKKKQRT